jgi:hypothetical protein
MDRMSILRNSSQDPIFAPVEPPPTMPGTFKTVGDLIDELSKLNPDMPALLYTSWQVGEFTRVGYVPYNKIGVTNVKKSVETPDWYDRSNDPDSYEVAAVTSTEEIY